MTNKKENFKITTKLPELPDIDSEGSELSLFDQNNPDLNLFNLVDDELIKLSGSKMYFYKYNQSVDFDPVYMESKNKPVSRIPILVHGHYEPEALSENLTNFGVELSSDQVFTFNKSYIERKLGRSVIPGDIIKPLFQNQKYQVFQVVEDSFEAYGVYHLVCSAKILRDAEGTVNTPLTKVDDPLGGYSHE